MIQKKVYNIPKEVNYFVESIGDGVFIINTDGKVLKCNKAICQMLGYKKEASLEGKRIIDILEAIDDKGKIINEKNAALFKSLKTGKKTTNAIRQFKKRDSSRFWASITTTPILNENHKITGAIFLVRDINEERQQEEFRNNFANIASHNLRTPLGNVMWAIEYLLGQKPGKLNDSQQGYLNDSYETLKNMNRLINDLLSISNLPYKKLTPKFTKVNLKNIYDKVYNDLQYYARAHNVSINLTCDDNIDFVIKADQHHARTIIQNIIENAIRYASASSKVEVSLKNENKYILLSCANHGIGIPKDKQKFIFAKFYRANNAVSKEGTGTGLGLYITKELVNLNKGQIWFESEENKTTTFFIRFKK